MDMNMKPGPMKNMNNMTMNGNHSGMDMGMHMYFYLSNQATILFKGWSTDTDTEMVGSCIAVFILAILYEALKVLREIMRRRYGYVVSVSLSKVHVPDERQTAMVVETRRQKGIGSQLLHWHHLLQTFLHIVQVVMSYFLMLIFMTYNGWLCISVALGAGTGYFLIGWRLSNVVDIYEHCH